jgi:hypothetical protein
VEAVADRALAQRQYGRHLNASKIFRLARYLLGIVALESSDHLLTARGQADHAGRIIGAWADAYLGDP